MTYLYFRKAAGGFLIPADDETAQALTKVKTGSLLRSDFTRMKEPNYRFLKKMHALAGLAFDHFCEHGLSQLRYKGQEVKPDYDRFRKDLTILAGHYTPVFNIRGEVRVEAKSWSYANATDEQREAIYSSLITAALKNIYNYQLTEDQLRRMVDDTLSFA